MPTGEVIPASPLLGKVLQSQGGRARLRDVIAAGLTDPERGYYTRNIRGLGARGDFTTTPLLDRSLAAAMADWARRRRKDFGLVKRAGLIECGPGGGELFRDVWRGLGWGRKWKWLPMLVEISPALRSQQESSLRGIGAEWYVSVQEALESCGGQAIVWGHEFADAFAPTVYEYRGGLWYELFAQQSEDGRVRVIPGDRGTVLEDFGGEWPEGQRVEMPELFGEWLHSARTSMRGGALLLIDYGGSTREVYHRRPRGTLRSYFHHERGEGLAALANLGRRDLTCDVNFDAVGRAARGAGFAVSGVVTLTQFVQRESGRNLSDEMSEAGEAFRVMELTVKSLHEEIS